MNHKPSYLKINHFRLIALIFTIITTFFIYSLDVNGQIVVYLDDNTPVDLSNKNYNFISINGEITESGKIIEYYDGHYVTNVKGTIEIVNPSDYDLYSINIPLVNDNNLYLIETTNTSYLFNTGIHIPILQAHDSVVIGYQWIGLTLERPHDEQVNLLHTAFEKDKIRMYADIALKLEKGPLENQSGEWRRLISVNIINPSNFVIKAIDIKLIKTDPGIMDVNNDSKVWKFHDTLLIPRTMMVGDILDYTNRYAEIYWISADTSVASYNLTPINNIDYMTEKDISGQEEIDLANDIISEQPQSELPFNELIVVRKFISDTLIKTDQIVTIKNLIYNFDSKTKTVKLKDYIPDNFELVEVISDEDRAPFIISEENLTWENIQINSRSGRIFTYKIKLSNKNATGIQYIEGSRVEFGLGSITSANIPVILQYLPEKKIFIQKKVSLINEREFLVEIEMKNLGDIETTNIVLKDIVSDESIFSEITKPFLKRGVWEINRINGKDSWIVSFVTDDKDTLQSVPLVFGMDADSIYTTLTVDNRIESGMINKTQYSEKIGIVVILIILVLYLISFTKLNKKKQ
jgi:hypothetical protein